MSTLTPNYQFVLPAVNNPLDGNRWGGQLNLNSSNLDSLLTSINASNVGATPPFVPATSAPTTGMLWLDTSSGGDFYFLKIYDGTDWATIGSLNTTLHEFSQNNVSYNMRVLTSSGTYTVPSGLTFAKITAIGGGGAGALAGGRGFGNATAGGGGGAGGVCIRSYTSTELGSSQTYTIGAGGTINGQGITGGNGSATTFSSGPLLLTANGGSGGTAINTTAGQPCAAAGGAGGTASGGTINMTGMAGLDGFASRNGDGNNYMMAGNGGNSTYGNGGQGGKILNISGAEQASGSNGSGYGTGGGGAGFVSSPGAITATAGTGAQGVIIVEEYF